MAKSQAHYLPIWTCLLIASIVSCLSVPRAHTASLTTLVKFTYETGGNPSSGVVLDDSGNLYGTTIEGGVFGDEGAVGEGGIFRLNLANNTLDSLAWFNGSTGLGSYANLMIDHAGKLYGTTNMSGQNGNGTIFRFDPGTSTISTVLAFDGTNGSTSATTLVADSGGTFYGTTGLGGTFGQGTVFRFNSIANTLTTLFSFSGPNGAYPDSTLAIDATGNLYGTTSRGGSENRGTVFKYSLTDNSLSTLASFDHENGDRPGGALLIDDSGNLFGITVLGGAYDKGTVFRFSTTTNTLTTLVSFDGANGSLPHSGMIADAAGNLYGTTSWGGIDHDISEGGLGTVFRLDTATNALTTLVFFDGYEGKHPFGELAVDAEGNLYGTTFGGGSGFGTVFRISDTGFAFPREGDFDEDGDVDGRDFLVWQRGGSPNPLSSGDLAEWQANYGTSGLSSLSAVVPEPTAVVICLMALSWAATRRRFS